LEKPDFVFLRGTNTDKAGAGLESLVGELWQGESMGWFSIGGFWSRGLPKLTVFFLILWAEISKNIFLLELLAKSTSHLCAQHRTPPVNPRKRKEIEKFKFKNRQRNFSSSSSSSS
jgi:hypothetical protein